MTAIAIVGAGNIGRTLGGAWQHAGHSVSYVSRTPVPPESLAPEDALATAEVVLLAIPGAAVDAFLDEYAGLLDGRLVIDATNRVGGDRLHSASELAARSPTARLVRAFNTVGYEVLADPRDADLFWCGPDGDDRALIEGLITDVGLRPIRVGDLQTIDVVDGVGKLWMTLVFRAGHPRTTAFKLLET
jgi:8-hydroxy-5-deazaflavin:NADPH oxidoreductase